MGLADKAADFLFDHVRNRWHRPSACVLGTLALLVWISDKVSHGWTRWPDTVSLVLALGAVAAFPLLWLWQHRFPHARRDRIGIVVAVSAERDEEQRQVRSDFIETTKKLLSVRGDEAALFDVLVMPNYRAEQVTDHKRAEWMLQRTGGILLLYGSVRWRSHSLSDQRVPYLTLEGAVRHKPATKEAEHDLAVDFRRSLPTNLFLLGSDVKGFEVTSEWVDVATRYVVGIAAHLSGAGDLAERLFLEVEMRLAGVSAKPPTLREISRRLPKRVIALYSDWLNFVIQRYVLTRDPGALRFADELAAKLLDRDRHNYRALILRSIAAFELGRDVETARRYLRACRSNRDVTWRYNLAFLLAYQGRMDEAVAEYERAFSGRVETPSVPTQTEESIHEVLTSEPDKYQLVFCSALVNDKVKRDTQTATRDYKAFIDEATRRSEYPRQIAAARAALTRMARS